MAIGAGSSVDQFGTLTSVDDGSTSSIASAAFSVAADITAWTNSDNVREAGFVLKCQWGTLPTATKPITLYARPINIQSTNDPPTPSTSYPVHIVGSFRAYASAINTDMYLTMIGVLPNLKSGQEYEFYLENGSGQTISAGWALWIMPETVGPS